METDETSPFYPCPHCGKKLRTKNGLAEHHLVKHFGEPAPRQQQQEAASP